MINFIPQSFVLLLLVHIYKSNTRTWKELKKAPLSKIKIPSSLSSVAYIMLRWLQSVRHVWFWYLIFDLAVAGIFGHGAPGGGGYWWDVRWHGWGECNEDYKWYRLACLVYILILYPYRSIIVLTEIVEIILNTSKEKLDFEILIIGDCSIDVWSIVRYKYLVWWSFSVPKTVELYPLAEHTIPCDLHIPLFPSPHWPISVTWLQNRAVIGRERGHVIAGVLCWPLTEPLLLADRTTNQGPSQEARDQYWPIRCNGRTGIDHTWWGVNSGRLTW